MARFAKEDACAEPTERTFEAKSWEHESDRHSLPCCVPRGLVRTTHGHRPGPLIPLSRVANSQPWYWSLLPEPHVRTSPLTGLISSHVSHRLCLWQTCHSVDPLPPWDGLEESMVSMGLYDLAGVGQQDPLLGFTSDLSVADVAGSPAVEESRDFTPGLGLSEDLEQDEGVEDQHDTLELARQRDRHIDWHAQLKQVQKQVMRPSTQTPPGPRSLCPCAGPCRFACSPFQKLLTLPLIDQTGPTQPGWT